MSTTINALALIYKRDNSNGADASAFKFDKFNVINPIFKKADITYPKVIKHCFIEGEDQVKNDVTGMTSVIQCGQHKQCNFVYLDLNKAKSESALSSIIDEMIDKHVKSKVVNSLYFAFQTSDMELIDKGRQDSLIYDNIENFINLEKRKVS